MKMTKNIVLFLMTIFIEFSIESQSFLYASNKECPDINLMKANKNNDKITIRFVGDIVFPSQDYKYNSYYKQHNFFSGVSDYLKTADISFGNLEGVLTNIKVPRRTAEEGKIYNFAFNPAFANLLKNSGFTMLNIANNHSHDYGTPGYDDTIKHLNKADLVPVGIKNDIKIKNVNNLKIGFVGFGFYSHQNSIQNEQETIRIIKEARNLSDYLIVSFHGGDEGPNAQWQDDKTEYFLEENRGNSVSFARTVIDAGADAVIGHGPHVLRSIECYKGKPIVYSLGNFMTIGGLSNHGPMGISMIFGVQLNHDGKVAQLEILPVYQTLHKLPWYDFNHQAIDFINKLAKFARYKGDFLSLDSEMAATSNEDQLYKDAFDTKRSFNSNEIMKLATQYNLKYIPPLIVKIKEQDLDIVIPHLDYLISQGKLQELVIMRQKRKYNQNYLFNEDHFYDPDVEITSSITKIKSNKQDLKAIYPK